MGCANCSNGTGNIPNGCKSNGNCGSGGCEKLEVYDWLADVGLPATSKKFDLVEVRFKNARKLFFRNFNQLDLVPGDVVVVEAINGYDVGVVSVTGEVARIQVAKKNPNLK